MPRIFMLGNGFDMHYNLPTSYGNFLHTVSFVGRETVKPGDTVGALFSKMKGLGIDSSISYYLSMESESYLNAVFDCSDCYKISYIQKALKTNKWIKYLSKQLAENGKWVDFEKEIAKVVDAIQFYIFEHDANPDRDELRIGSSNILWEITEAFSMDGEQCGRSDIEFYKSWRRDLIITSFPGSVHKVLNLPKIIEELSDSLSELNQTLRFYLECFAEKPLSVMVAKKTIRLDSIFTKADAVVSFNYTNTFEKLYPGKKVCHIHGALPGEVVLGIDSNQFDELNSIDTSFIGFKKYYQRATLCTDTKYRKLIWDLEERKKNQVSEDLIELRVVGHSLDKTDKEIIRELFALADRIWIYYYKVENIGEYNRNLISIYGRQAFEQIRNEKQLQYVSLEALNNE